VRQQPERAEQAAIVKLLKLLGASVYVIGTKRRKGEYQGTMQTPGIPDLYVVLPSPMRGASGHDVTPLWIEVKAKAGRLSAAQRRFHVESQQVRIPHLIGGIDVVSDWLRQGGWIK
jgi:hypothetical protein